MVSSHELYPYQFFPKLHQYREHKSAYLLSHSEAVAFAGEIILQPFLSRLVA